MASADFAWADFGKASPVVRRDFAGVLCVGSPGAAAGLASGACARLVLVLT